MKNAAHIKHEKHMPPYRRIILSNSDGDYFVDPDNIISIEAADNQSCFKLALKEPHYNKIVISKTLEVVEGTYSFTGLIRVHRSWIVNLRHVRLRTKCKETKNPILIMSDGTEVPVAKTRLELVKQEMMRIISLVN